MKTWLEIVEENYSIHEQGEQVVLGTYLDLNTRVLLQFRVMSWWDEKRKSMRPLLFPQGGPYARLENTGRVEHTWVAEQFNALPGMVEQANVTFSEHAFCEVRVFGQ